MDKATYGLIGVAVGFFLTFLKDWWLNRTKQQKEISYLAIHVSCALDRFVDGCAKVVGDDGLYQGQPDQNDCHYIQVNTPNFQPGSLDVDWKSLPAKTLYDILNFPLVIETSNATIGAVFEHNSYPPDYCEGFEERQLQYAVLGIKADELASRLRKLGKLPSKEIFEYSSIKYIMNSKSRIEELRELRNKEQQARNASVA